MREPQEPQATDLSKLHDEIHQASDAFVIRETGGPLHQFGDRDVAPDLVVHDPLSGGEVAVQIDLDLRGLSEVSPITLSTRLVQ